MSKMVRFVSTKPARATTSPPRSTLGLHIALIATIVFVLSPPVLGDVIPFNDRDSWLNAIGNENLVTTIDFTGFPETTIITDQYQAEGVTFFGFIDTINHNPNIFPNDDWGLDGNGDINLRFDRPIHWIGAHYPGQLRIELFSNGQYLFGGTFVPTDIVGNFAGVCSSAPFDEVVLIDPGDEAAIDDLYFVIPTPATLLPFTLLLVRRSSRRDAPCH